MKIVVLNGSPKGDMSITMQYIHYIQKKFPMHELNIIHVAQHIKKIEGKSEEFQKIIDAVKTSDGVLWAFPLYFCLVSSQYKRFIELISERKAKSAFKGRYTAIFTTSIHFFDHTAHNYMHAICDDLDMRYAGSFSAAMYDLLDEKERERLILFFRSFFRAIENKAPTQKSFMPLEKIKFKYVPGNVENTISADDKKIVVLTDDVKSGNTNVSRMVGKFISFFSGEVEVANLHDVEIEGGCLGCIQCGFDNVCAYQDIDGYVEFYEDTVKTADILIFAGTVVDRYLSSKWKQFFDRSFFNTHIPSLIGKQIGFIISGPLRELPDLRQILETHVELQRANCAGFITDESYDSSIIDRLLEGFAEQIVWFSKNNYIKPATFLGVGGMKIFRDEIFGKLRFPFQADHRFYRKHRMYDFPQKDIKSRIENAFLMLITKIASVRKEIYKKKLRAEMIRPLKKVD